MWREFLKKLVKCFMKYFLSYSRKLISYKFNDFLKAFSRSTMFYQVHSYKAVHIPLWMHHLPVLTYNYRCNQRFGMRSCILASIQPLSAEIEKRAKLKTQYVGREWVFMISLSHKWKWPGDISISRYKPRRTCNRWEGLGRHCNR